MIAVDTNVLVYAHRGESRIGEEAYATLTGLAKGDTAWDQFVAWTRSPTHRMIGETDGFAELLGRFVQRPHVVGGVVHDAGIAAICVAHGVEALLTRDRDFSLFPERRTRNPFGTVH